MGWIFKCYLPRSGGATTKGPESMRTIKGGVASKILNYYTLNHVRVNHYFISYRLNSADIYSKMLKTNLLPHIGTFTFAILRGFKKPPQYLWCRTGKGSTHDADDPISTQIIYIK